jgi:hypothetical protein
MRAFIEAFAVPSAERSLEQRVQGYRAMYADLGFLTPVAVEASTPTQLTCACAPPCRASCR